MTWIRNRYQETELNKTHSFWVAPLLQSRDGVGEFHLRLEELKLYHGQFWVYFTTSVGKFEQLLHIWDDRAPATQVAPLIGDTLPCVVFNIVVFRIVMCLSNHPCCRETRMMSSSTVVADVGDMMYNHHEWMMCLFAVWKLKNKMTSIWKVLLFHSPIFSHSHKKNLLVSQTKNVSRPFK